MKINKSDFINYLLFDYLWLIAFCPKILQFMIIAAITFALWIKHPIRKVKGNGFIITYMVVTLLYAFSIMMALISTEHETLRIFAAFNTLAITFFGIVLYQIYQSKKVDMKRIHKSMFRNMCILIGIWLLFVLIGEKGNNLSFLPGPLCGSDWSNGIVYTRFCGYLEYVNLMVYMHLFTFGLSIDYVLNKYGRLFASIYAVVSLFPVISARSRVGILGCLLVVIISVLFMYRKSIAKFFVKNKLYLTILILFSALVMSFICKDFLIDIYEKVINYRAGSSGTRLAIYTDSLNKMLSESPIWGCGIKDIWNVLPYGSHSTFIGMYYKTGLVGGTIFLIGICGSVTKKCLKMKNYNFYRVSMNLSLIGILVVSMFEDLDGANWNFAMFMIFVSFAYRENKTEISNYNKR